MLKKFFYQHKRGVLLVMILAIVSFIFLPSLDGELISYQDKELISQSEGIVPFHKNSVKNLFTPPPAFKYQPLTLLTFSLEKRFLGDKPFFYHLNNLLLHLCVIIGVFYLAGQFGLSGLGAAVAAFVFGIHPLHVRHVAWVSSRADILCAVFYLVSLFYYCNYLHSYNASRKGEKNFKKRKQTIEIKKGPLILSFFFYGLSCLSHYLGLSLVFVLFALDWFFSRDKESRIVKEKILFISLFMAFLLWHAFSYQAEWLGINFYQMGLLSFWKFTFFIRQFIVPVGLSPFYRMPQPVSFINGEYLISVGIAGLIIFSVIRLKQKKWYVFSLVFYVLSSFGFFALGRGHANYVPPSFFYLPSLAFCLFFGFCWEQVLMRFKEKERKAGAARGIKAFKYFTGIILSSMFLFWVYSSFQQVEVWQDESQVWKKQLSLYPDDYFALNRLGTILRQQKSYQDAEIKLRGKIRASQLGLAIEPFEGPLNEDALSEISYVIELYQKAIENNPDFLDAYLGLADTYASLGLSSKAVQIYREIIVKDPQSWEAYYGLAHVYRQQGESQSAVAVYDALIALDYFNLDFYYQAVTFYNQSLMLEPENRHYQEARNRAFEEYIKLINQEGFSAETYFNLGFLFQQMGDFERSSAAYWQVLKENPGHVRALFSLGDLHRDFGLWDEALSLYQKAIDLNPRQAGIYTRIGGIYNLKNQIDKAMEYFYHAIDRNEKDGRAYFELGYLYEKKGNLRRAINFYEKAAEYLSNDEQIFYNLGNIYFKLDLKNKALEYYKKAIAINPKYLDAYINLSIVAFKSGDYAAAVKYCDLAVMLGYDAPEAYLQTLEAYRK